ncbi:hypothetical protein RJT34_03348 [Clitoria ternatea]|uniref:F-box domain-containing protein n=1 Tax=Clitoria ternatea TaxID=43366 RepID=A0AAN9KK38_CLITE
MMKSAKKLNPTLPNELIVEILLKLPVRSLSRFKCVSKLWFSQISSPQFAKTHFDLDPSPTHRILLRLTNNDSQAESIDVDTLLHDHNDDVSDIINLTFLPPSPRIHPYGISDSSMRNLGSCRGFMLLSNFKGDVVVWNPSTGAYRRISQSHYGLSDRFLNGIGYDASVDDYLVVLVQMNPLNNDHLDDPEPPPRWPTRIKFFSLKTHSWFSLNGAYAQYMDTGGVEFNSGSFLNEALHWLVVSLDKKAHVILAFDLVRRTLFEIPLPDDIVMRLQVGFVQIYLRVMGECLALTFCNHKKAEIWMMKEYNVHSSWTKLFVLPIHAIPHKSFIPICFTKNGGILGSNNHVRLVKFNEKGKLIEHRAYGKEEGYVCSLLHFFTYRESLLSFPSDFEESSEGDHEQTSEDDQQ